MCANEIVPKEYIAKIKPEQLEALVKNGTFTKNADGTYTSNVPIGNTGAVKADNEVKGLAVESAQARNAVQTPETPKIALADNDVLQKQKLEQYKKEYTELYKKDPSILKTDIADVVYAKEKEQIAASLENGAKSVDGRILLKDRYMKEFASDEETEKFKKVLTEKLAYYSDPKNAELARYKYNEAFHETHKENYIRQKEEMTPSEIKLIAHREALDETVKLEDSTYSKMANSLIQNRHLNQAINTTNEYQEKIQKALAEGDTQKAEKLKEKAAKELIKAKKEETKEVQPLSLNKNINVLVLCVGAGTSAMFANAVKEGAEIENLPIDATASAYGSHYDILKDYDIVVLSPQVQSHLEEVRQDASKYGTKVVATKGAQYIKLTRDPKGAVEFICEQVKEG